MTTELVPIDYSALPTSESKWLKEKVGAIKLIARQTATNIINIGNHLMEVRERIKDTPIGFVHWLETEFSWSCAQAYRFMNVARAFKELPSEVTSQFDSTALMELAQPKVPDKTRKLAIGIAESGIRVTHADVKQILAADKNQDEPTRAEINGYHKERGKLAKETKENDCRNEIKRDVSNLMYTEEKAKLWDMFEELIKSATMVTFSRVEDDIDDAMMSQPFDGKDNFAKMVQSVCPLLCSVYKKNGVPKTHASSSGLKTLILTACQKSEQRQCKSCKEWKDLYQGFSHKKMSKNDRCQNCKQCETQRVREYRPGGKRWKPKQTDVMDI